MTNDDNGGELIDFGAVSTETRGGSSGKLDFINLPQPVTGLSDD